MAKAATVDWFKRFRAGCCSIGLKAEDKLAALDEAATNMVKGKALDSSALEEVVKVLRGREARATTGVGMGVAISHVAMPGIDQALCSLSLHPEGLDWSAVDGAPVHIVFLVLRPEMSTPNYDPEDHIDMMRWIAGLAREADFRAFALQATKRSELVELLREMQPEQAS
ncbi:MAG: PTS sugar transporter subunit IIA [Planctomycetes bacterium]|nr:PTS sugar transporter subunit IIA [Planctomycetota bacterium]MCB9910403.1 PTS sugar transporter subunit IIA [Planctomycetota bacterium]HPF13797.1 PTS sugar transporter subunit IIA [Planctomycetota bacterium]HRV79835.1 PTS sugar transporter subunit IIA [Planctomycetota bacterium]